MRFFEVDESELEKQRAAFSSGQLEIKIEQQRFSMRSASVTCQGYQSATHEVRMQAQWSTLLASLFWVLDCNQLMTNPLDISATFGSLVSLCNARFNLHTAHS